MSTKAKIALIEDDVPIVTMYHSKFEKEGYEVKTASDGESGLSLIEVFQPDIILLDIMMPGMNGIDMLKKTQALPGAQSAKIIVLTNLGSEETAAELKDLGVSDYLVKSDLTPSQVAGRIKLILNG